MAVLGELIIGILLGNLGLVGIHFLEPLKHNPFISGVASVGIVVLLFEVGLQSTVREMLAISLPSLAVALPGVLASFALGWLAGAWLLPGHSIYVHAFLGATLTATSVGISARVLRDLGALKRAEARLILGAAVVDDVLGLIILAVATGALADVGAGNRIGFGPAAIIVAKALVFLVGGSAVGLFVVPRFFRAAAVVPQRPVVLLAGLAVCFVLSWLADVVGLAPIIGAFAAGLILEDVYLVPFGAAGEGGMAPLVAPLSRFLAPVFFLLVGMRTDLRAFAQPGVIGLAAALTLAAVLGKLACAVGVPRGVDRVTVALGMIPRGEVELIFASTGLTLVAGEPVVTPAIYSAIVITVIVTTMLTPPLLKWRLVDAPA